MSFKRQTTSSRPTAPPVPLASTGVPSLDDILGGGIPLSCSLVVIAPDLHSQYAELVQKYFVAQGLVSRQRVCVVGTALWVRECMWLAAGASDADEPIPSDEKIKIAWRYEQMKQFQTTVASSSSAAEDACRTFDLTTRIPSEIVADALTSGQLSFVDVESTPGRPTTVCVLERLSELLARGDTPLRICVPSLGSPDWGDLAIQDILRFLHGLRALLQRHSYACVSSSLAPARSADSAGWYQKLGWVSDAAITMAAFTANPALASAFPAHHGLVQIHTLPAPQSLVPASDRFSTLRGAVAGGGENNLGFKCTRKRLVFETLHLDIDGGVGERRTSAPAAVLSRASMGALVEVEVEGTVGGIKEAAKVSGGVAEVSPESRRPKKAGGKRVGFHSDRPEVYDF
ncbi:PAXNEB-domain-containing protein [Mycena belliarum]|uniref:Elongator complex protein 4 n=1 Tax=Mycena belliarum TaxID=1033014 RepID=A0AAD6UGS2_9AGAR|nr:PAXNEB-domain-containing protein [Mycena belliae]